MSALTESQQHRVAMTAALLGGTLLGHKQFCVRYNPDPWGGMVGLMREVAHLAAQLEEQTHYAMGLGDGVDWYLTCDVVVEAWLAAWARGEHGALAQDLSPYFVTWEAGA